VRSMPTSESPEDGDLVVPFVAERAGEAARVRRRNSPPYAHNHGNGVQASSPASGERCLSALTLLIRLPIALTQPHHA
jgi:hypothetical protein